MTLSTHSAGACAANEPCTCSPTLPIEEARTLSAPSVGPEDGNDCVEKGAP